jgi:uncharacterized membrane protein YfcA
MNLNLDLLHPTTSVPAFELFLFAISIGAGTFGAILGLGGGVIIVPVLTLGLGINIRYAIGASIVSVIGTSSGAAVTYIRDHITNIRVALLLEVATTLGALGGVFLSTHIPQDYLFLAFSLILFYSAGMMLKKRHTFALDKNHPDFLANYLKLNSSYPDPTLGKEVSYSVTHVPLGFSLMLGAGVLSGMLGIGSGALKVPAMDSAMRLPIKVSTATSNFMIGVTAAGSAGAYYMRGDILPILAAPVALGVLAGSFLGTRIMMRLPNSQIRALFIVFLMVIAVQMGLKAFGVNT